MSARSDQVGECRSGADGSTPGLRPWRFVVAFGVVSMLADFVYEGARSITGPLLASLGASAVLVGLVTGAGEAAALILRLVFGPLADRTGRFWTLTIAGYALTVVTVPLLGLSATLGVACALVIAERIGKAVRSPAKDTLLSHATAATGRGRGFAVHEALDQFGAVLGPLLVAAILATTGSYRTALLGLALPGIGVLALLVWLRARVPHPVAYEPIPAATAAPTTVGNARRPRLPRDFWLYGAFTALTLTGFATFGVLSYHLATAGLIPIAAIPVVYAAAMGVDALAALATGFGYDRIGPDVLVALPVLAAGVPIFAFTTVPAIAISGSLLWGAALGVQESTMRAVVADLVPPGRRATAYGIFAAVAGAATFVGGLLAGLLYSRSIPALIAMTATIQAVALVLLFTLRRRRRRRRSEQLSPRAPSTQQPGTADNDERHPEHR